jgi:tRNA pseudouridine13 synthase
MSGRGVVFGQAGATVEGAHDGGDPQPAGHAGADPQPPGTAVIRRAPEDFVVEEIPAYTPSGRGEHLYLTFTKRGLTTPDAVRALAQALDVDPRGAGFAGMKDRHAVTTQTASFAFPMARDAAAAVAAVAVPGVTVVSAARHDNKLKPGHLIGNRFTIALADVLAAEVPEILRRLAAIGRIGVPNAFGPQRFGRDGDNPERALGWLSGRERGPRSPREQRLLFSSLQSLLFNRVLARREAAGTWAAVLPGDVAKKHDTGGLFTVPLEGPDLDDARARAEAGAVSATGPMFGAKMRWPEGEPAALEREVLDQATAGAGAAEALRFEAFRHLGEGTRRALRLFVAEMTTEVLSPGLVVTMGETPKPPARPAPGETPGAPQPGATSTGRAVVVARFVLPKGGYATTVLGRACRLIDGSRPGAPPIEDPGDDPQDP